LTLPKLTKIILKLLKMFKKFTPIIRPIYRFYSTKSVTDPVLDGSRVRVYSEISVSGCRFTGGVSSSTHIYLPEQGLLIKNNYNRMYDIYTNANKNPDTKFYMEELPVYSQNDGPTTTTMTFIKEVTLKQEQVDNIVNLHIDNLTKQIVGEYNKIPEFDDKTNNSDNYFRNGHPRIKFL
jgi:hypothetical protein